jgi:hydroxyacylglutathione hydrolase
MLDKPINEESFYIVPIPLFEDNYSYLIYINPEVGVLIDPADSDQIKSFLSSEYPSMIISHILLTHKHWDHAGGVQELITYFEKKNQKIHVVAGEEENLNYVTIPIIGKEQTINIFNKIPVKCYKVPCHTKGHLLYHFEMNVKNSKEKHIKDNKFTSINCLFTGDTLFIGGSGKFFEGDAQDMYYNLELIKSLSIDTQIFCGHEYTVSNLEWALGIEWENDKIREKLTRCKELVSKGLFTIPSSIQDELDTNVFLRYNSDTIKKRLNIQDEIEILSKLRDLKNKKMSLKSNIN